MLLGAGSAILNLRCDSFRGFNCAGGGDLCVCEPTHLDHKGASGTQLCVYNQVISSREGF